MPRPGKKPLPKEVKEFEEAVIQMDRVTRVVKGGRRMRFRATVVIGDKKGNVGYGIGKAAEVQQAIQKAVSKARKRMIKVPVYNGTIPHMVQVKYKSSSVMMKPASIGTGIIAGGAVRQILELAGVHNILSKSLGSNNKINTAKATYEALTMLRARPDMETDREKGAKAEAGEDRSAPEVKKMSKSEAEKMVNADKRMNKPAGKKPAHTAKQPSKKTDSKPE
jgi:small subunit ribosomal protein S5